MSRRVVLLGRMLWLMPVVALLWPSARAESQKATPSVKARIWQDERIGIVINKVEVGETLSPKVAESLKGPPDGPNGPFPTRARAGSKYVCIVFTLARVKGVYVFSFGPGVKLGAQESSLRDDGGRAYGLTYWRPSHFIITDVQDPTKARYHLPEAGTSIMIFEVPLDATPRSLTLFYAYTNSLADKDYKQGRLDITL